MSIVAASKKEVVQVAHDLLDPLMENVHRDVENLRAQLVAQEQVTQKLRADYIKSQKQLTDRMRRYEHTFGKILARLAEMENRR